MRSFRYTAKVGPGERVQGVLQGESSSGVARALLAKGMFPVDVREILADTGVFGRFDFVRRLSQRLVRRRMGSQPLALFTRRLGDLLDAGVPMQRAMEQLHRQTREAHLKNVLGSVARRVQNGDSLSHALAAFGDVFPQSLVGAVEAGETGGGLIPILQGLAELYEKEDELQRSVRAAMLYPVLVLVVSMATLLVMFLYLLPRLSGLYTDLGRQLPAPTRFLIATSDFFQTSGTLVLVFIAALFAGLAVLRSRSERFRRLVASVLLKTPYFGRIILHREIVRFAHSLASLVGGGVPLMRSLWFASRSSGNIVIADELRGFGQLVGEGASLSEVIGESRIGDDVLVMMVQVGEEMGQLAPSLEKACRVYERELRERMHVITTVLEPLLIVSIGLIVGFIVFSMMLPIMELDLV